MDRGAGVLDASAIRAFHDRLDSPIAVSAELDDGEHVLAELRCLDELRNTIRRDWPSRRTRRNGAARPPSAMVKGSATAATMSQSIPMFR